MKAGEVKTEYANMLSYLATVWGPVRHAATSLVSLFGFV